MYYEDQSRGPRLLTGLLLGVLVGAIVALVSAPVRRTARRTKRESRLALAKVRSARRVAGEPRRGGRARRSDAEAKTTRAA
ncbi:MAG TPA: hypothetical protein VFX29_08345 [Longimicrobiaceae bacterium]|jgi:gas vesicle protein|nr:hypothetical protein [Longimicrobiaceae bacterium]